MSLWTIERKDGEKVSLRFTHEPLDPNPLIQPCGLIDVAAEQDLLAWAFDQAQPWDLIATPDGTFMRQPMPLGQA